MPNAAARLICDHVAARTLWNEETGRFNLGRRSLQTRGGGRSRASQHGGFLACFAKADGARWSIQCRKLIISLCVLICCGAAAVKRRMTVRLWLQNALATVSKSLTGRKRKAVDERQEEEDGALPSQLPPPSSERPQPQQAVGSAGRRVPERLDFSSPAMNGQKWGGTKGLRGAAAPGTTHPQQAGASTPGPTRRLDGSLAADLAGTAVGLRSRQHDMLPATGVPLPPQIAATAPRGRPLAKRFKQPRMTAQRSDVSFPVLSNVSKLVGSAGGALSTVGCCATG